VKKGRGHFSRGKLGREAKSLLKRKKGRETRALPGRGGEGQFLKTGGSEQEGRHTQRREGKMPLQKWEERHPPD